MYKNKELVLGGEKVRCVGGLVVEKDFQLSESITLSNANIENVSAGNINVTGTTVVQNETVNEDLTVNGDMTVDNNLSVGNNVVVNGNINAGYNTTTNLFILESYISTSNAKNSKEYRLVSNLQPYPVIGEWKQNGDFETPGTVSAGTDLTVANNANVSGDLSVDGLTTSDGVMYLRKDEELGGPVKGTYGSNGSRLVYYKGTPSAVPYGVGVNTAELYTTVPEVAKHTFRCGTTTKLTVDSGGVEVNGDLTVLGNLYSGLGLAVHVVADQTIQRSMTAPQYFNPAWFSPKIQTKQALIDLTDVTGFKLLESGTYVIYFKYQLFGTGLTAAKFRVIQEGNIVDRFFGELSVANNVYNDKIVFIQADANDIISIELEATIGTTNVQLGYHQYDTTQFGVVKLA